MILDRLIFLKSFIRMIRNVACTKVVISRNSTLEIDGRHRKNIGEKGGKILFVFLFWNGFEIRSKIEFKSIFYFVKILV